MPAESKYQFTNAITVTVAALRGGYAQVTLPDGGQEEWSLSGLPKGIKAGDCLEVRAAAGHFDIRVTGQAKKR